MTGENGSSTLERIHTAAKAEFLEKGFQKASLRNIVKTASVTTGAFYGYYDSKEELFDALVGEQAEHILTLFGGTIDAFEELTGEEQTSRMLEVSGDITEQMIDYMYEHYDAFRLLILCAEGTRYADFVHQIVEREETSTYTYMETLKQMGYSVEPISRKLIHMVASGMFSGIFETIVHHMERGEAKTYVRQMERFYAAGWEALLGVKFGRE